MINVLYFLQDVFMIVRQLIINGVVAVALSLVAPMVIGEAVPPEKDSGLDFATMIRELQAEVKKIKYEIIKLHEQLQERQERAEHRRSLQKQQEQKQQDLEYQNSRKP